MQGDTVDVFGKQEEDKGSSSKYGKWPVGESHICRNRRDKMMSLEKSKGNIYGRERGRFEEDVCSTESWIQGKGGRWSLTISALALPPASLTDGDGN